MDMSNTIRFLAENFAKILTRGGLIVHPDSGVMYQLRFDPQSYDQVLVFSKFDGYDEVVMFCATEFGVYIKDAETETIEHYFYHTLIGTQLFGLTFSDLAELHYMFKNFPNT